MVCKFCGNTIEDSSEFCFICGNKVMKEEAPEVFAEAKPAEVPVVAAPAEAQQPIYAQPAPVYAQQAYAQPAPAAPVEEGKKKKKDKSVCSKAKKFFAALFAMTFILQFIPWIWYKNAKKAGYEEKAVSILNSLMTGLCIFMAIICAVLIKTGMF
ncbi:MAG: hypothetical protein IKB94_07590 [Clostridia bacterium]|nr:hypothetical protein [Clostridia bacterium]MBR2893700.1 hypothetical protein [Clostridia bacterium]